MGRQSRQAPPSGSGAEPRRLARELQGALNAALNKALNKALNRESPRAPHGKKGGACATLRDPSGDGCYLRLPASVVAFWTAATASDADFCTAAAASVAVFWAVACAVVAAFWTAVPTSFI